MGGHRTSNERFEHLVETGLQSYTRRPVATTVLADPLAPFTEAVRDWFRSSFEAPTDAQARGWEAIARGEHTLIHAPTGSGKTLAAFLYALDRLSRDPSPPPTREKPGHVRVLYISPLKALTYDVERNLRAPLTGIGLAAQRNGTEPPHITVASRTGDTPQEDRREIARRPPDILITTPESLYLLLTSQAREILKDVEYVIVDEGVSALGDRRPTLGLGLRGVAEGALEPGPNGRRERPERVLRCARRGGGGVVLGRKRLGGHGTTEYRRPPGFRPSVRFGALGRSRVMASEAARC